MEMTNKEIVRRYLAADRKRPQIEILADLNGTDTSKIKEILIAEGVMKKSGPKGPRKLQAVVADDTVHANVGSASVPTILRDAAHLGIELINIRIAEKETEIKEANIALAALKCQRQAILQSIHKLHPDNDGKAVVVNE